MSNEQPNIDAAAIVVELLTSPELAPMTVELLQREALEDATMCMLGMLISANEMVSELTGLPVGGFLQVMGQKIAEARYERDTE